MTGTPLFWCWAKLRQRCNNPNDSSYPQYGARGIVVCDGFDKSFPFFAIRMGSKPSPDHSIDRIDNDAGYTCGSCRQCATKGWAANCRWATRSEQAANRRVSVMHTRDGVTLCLKDWCSTAICSTSYSAVRSRIKKGWGIDDAITMPVGANRPNHIMMTLGDRTMNLSAWSRTNECVVSGDCLGKRVRTGWDFAKALTTPSRLQKKRMPDASQ
jgi:hypothetical protein